jgi:ABC-type branched-subunit amino acid transport system ATPase component/branched-subunit amino acid ABC-type transport system permease component
MAEFTLFLVLGLATGGVYSVVALGVVLVYRGSGIVNFAAGGLALLGAALYYELADIHGLPMWLAMLCGVTATAAAGGLMQLLIMRPMRNSSPLMRVVATLGVLSLVQVGATKRYGGFSRYPSSLLPRNSVKVLGTTLTLDRILILGIAIVLTIGLAIVYKRTRFGLATTGVAENERITAALGWSPARIAAANWTAGGALCGLAGTLLVPITSLDPSALALTIVPALCAALVGGFRSFPLTLVGALVLGVASSEALLLQAHDVLPLGWSNAVPFLTIITILVVRGRALPLRGSRADKLPRVGGGEIRWVRIVVALGLVCASFELFTDNWTAAVTTSAIFGIIALSLVVVTGYAGQLSLCQFAIAGLGALISSRFAAALDVPFPAALLLGVVLAAPIGVIVAMPALRVRGVNLAVVTLALSVVISSAVLANPDYTGGSITGTVLSEPSLFGWNVSSIKHPVAYALVCLALFLGAALAVSNLRRSRTGRRLLALRTNERGAASVGVSVFKAKLDAFAVASAIAALGGCLIAFRMRNVEFTQFEVFGSINMLLLSVVGSVGFVSGAVVAGPSAPSAVGEQLASSVVDTSVNGWYALVAPILLIIVLITHQDGIADLVAHRWNGLKRRIRPSRRPDTSAQPTPSPAEEVAPADLHRVQPQTLDVTNMSVRFGGITAVDGVSFCVNPGEIVGLIGPNGAGKTTIIDATTGFERRYQGDVFLDGHCINRYSARRRARSGLVRSFQSLELFDDLSVADNLRVAAEGQDRSSVLRDLVRPRRRPLPPAAVAAIAMLELGHVMDRFPAELPYAQRRIVGIARAVALSPSVLMLDEPAAGLDDRSTRELSTLIRRLASQGGMSIVLVEHDVAMVLRTCDRVVALDFGKVIAAGTPQQVRQDPAVIASYLGAATDAEPDVAPEYARSTAEGVVR